MSEYPYIRRIKEYYKEVCQLILQLCEMYKFLKRYKLLKFIQEKIILGFEVLDDGIGEY